MNSAEQPSTSESGPTYKVAIVDASKNRFSRLTDLLESQNLKVNFVVGSSNEATFIKDLVEVSPDIVILNLFLEGKSTLPKIKAIKSTLTNSKIIVLTAHNSINNIRESVKSGADDFVLDPFEPSLMLDRIRYQLQEREMYSPEAFATDSSDSGSAIAAESQKNVDLIYFALRSLSEITSYHEAMTTVLESVAENAKSTRVNLIEGDLETNKGLVAASSDDKALEDLKIDLEKYPEVREVLLNGNIIYIKDITQNPLTKGIQDKVKSIKITSLLVFPIRHRSHTLGSLNIRMAGSDSVSERQLKTYFTIALALGPKLAAKKLLRKHKKVEVNDQADLAPRDSHEDGAASMSLEAALAANEPLAGDSDSVDGGQMLDELLTQANDASETDLEPAITSEDDSEEVSANDEVSLDDLLKSIEDDS